ncbi:YebC/PmpR family DNA-binding transcriptional regulator [bacterium]|nr:YebC/PmpR family DNA-binding transcriptional regulator [bacterium]
MARVSGHNKWSSIKHRKAAQDSKRQAVFNKIIREVAVAAKDGGADPSINSSLAAAMEKAKTANMPKHTLEKAIKRGAGGGGEEIFTHAAYEGRGPAGTALIVSVLTDNKNRAVADIRNIFSKHGGALGENGSVSWMFARKGMLIVNADALSEDDLLEACAEAGAEDFRIDGEVAEIYTDPDDFAAVREWFSNSERYKMQSFELAMVPKETVEVTEEGSARKLFRLLDALDDNADVQSVYSNWSMRDDLVEKVAAE